MILNTAWRGPKKEQSRQIKQLINETLEASLFTVLEQLNAILKLSLKKLHLGSVQITQIN